MFESFEESHLVVYQKKRKKKEEEAKKKDTISLRSQGLHLG